MPTARIFNSIKMIIICLGSSNILLTCRFRKIHLDTYYLSSSFIGFLRSFCLPLFIIKLIRLMLNRLKEWKMNSKILLLMLILYWKCWKFVILKKFTIFFSGVKRKNHLKLLSLLKNSNLQNLSLNSQKWNNK